MNITIDFIKHIEYNFIIPKITEMRNKIFPLLKDIKNVSKGLTNIENDILSLRASTKTFLKNNSNIIFTRTDKGNIVVALDKHEYIQKMELLFADSNTYKNLRRNPINKIITELKLLLKHFIESITNTFRTIIITI